MLSYATIQTRILQLLQDTGSATYDTTELGYWMEDELKRISRFHPLIIDVVFQVESRRGTDVTGLASSVSDSVKSQFLSTDPTKEKVVHNTTDHTWAVVLTNTDTTANTLSRDIMDANEKYEIYNKRCRNKRQIYIGDMPPYLWIDSVEYPIGTERNFSTPQEDILELDVNDNTILDSDSTLANLNPVNVLVRFAVPQLLSQLTDWNGALTAAEDEGDTTIAIGSIGTATEVIEESEQFHLADHQSLYIVIEALPLSTGAGNLKIYPPLEADAASTSIVYFRKSTLTPELEEILCQRVAARAMLSNTVTKVASINPGGRGAYERERRWAMDMLEETEATLKGGTRAKPSKALPRT